MEDKEIRYIIQRVEEILNNVKHATGLKIVIEANEDEYPTINYSVEEVAC